MKIVRVLSLFFIAMLISSCNYGFSDVSISTSPIAVHVNENESFPIRIYISSKKRDEITLRSKASEAFSFWVEDNICKGRWSNNSRISPIRSHKLGATIVLEGMVIRPIDEDLLILLIDNEPVACISSKRNVIRLRLSIYPEVTVIGGLFYGEGDGVEAGAIRINTIKGL